jgi:hypothetical protein
MFYGGDLGKHESFKNILSIGYEFETHDLAKLSLNDDNNLINSSIIFMTLKNKLKIKEAKKIDKNSYEIDDNGKKYIEYYDEQLEGDTENVMNITNDIGGSNFDKMLYRKCKKTDDKNNIYSFETNEGKKYKITFDSQNMDKCFIFTGPEFVITFYKIQKSKNIILETFLNACYRIFTHLSKLDKITGNLLIKDKDNKDVQIGNLKDRILYHKPDSNLYYLQTHDSAIFSKEYSIGMISIMPQMTFRANITHVIQIIKDILYNDNFEYAKQNKKMIMREYDIVNDIDKCINELIEDYNKKAPLSKWKLNPSNKIVKEIIGYLFMIFYKIYMYVESYFNSDLENTSENYFKNYLSFASRHMNYIFYKKIKGLLYEYFGNNWDHDDDNINTEDINDDLIYIIISLIYKPEIIQKYMYHGRKKKILKVKLNVDDENYGNPAYSFISYFNHFEIPGESKNEDNTDEQQREWFINSEIDVSSTNFGLPEDGSIIIENRLFFYELSTYMRDEVNLNAPNYFTLNNLKNIYYKLIEKNKKVVDLSKKELNPKTERFVNKCEKGKIRDDEFHCIIKSKKSKKVGKKTKKAKK